MMDTELTLTMVKMFESMKRGEECRIEIERRFVPTQDKALHELLTASGKYDESQMIMAHLKLHNLIKSEDWFKDESTIVRTLRKGKGRTPFVDSLIKFRLQILVNGNQIVNNYPDNWNFETSEDLSQYKTTEAKKEYLQSVSNDLYYLRLDSYELPSLLIKIIKTMKKNGVTEIVTTRIDKLQTNFKNDQLGLDPFRDFKDGDKVTIRVSLLDCSYPQYFYKLLVKQKLEHIQYLKANACRFFKSSLPNGFKKAADLYQKINGYYNFGDSTNNYAKEDENDPEFIRNNEELQGIKLSCFVNLVVCKHKMGEFNSVLNITDQILDERMDPKNTKALYFKGYAELKLQDYEQSVQSLQQCLNLDPNHAEAKKLLLQAKQERQKYRD